jgi:DnaK suppressor protein
MTTRDHFLNASADDFMNPDQLAYMRSVLEQMRAAIFDKQPDDHNELSDRPSDPLDSAQQQEEFLVRMRMRAMETDLLRDIDRALVRIDTGTYGYGESTGSPIDIRRLLAYPTSCTSVSAKREKEARNQYHSVRAPA